MAECSIRTLPTPAIALVMARRGQARAASSAAEQALGAVLPSTPRIVYGNDIALLWCGPERWLVLAEAARAAAAGGIETLLEPVFGDTASVTDQSGSRVLLDVAGNGARELLSRTLPLDLHASVFGPGHTALCRAHYVSLQLWQAGAEERFVLALPRSHAAGFGHWLVGAVAAAVGVPV